MTRSVFCSLLILILSACETRNAGKREQAIAVAWAGPVSLPLRSEISPKSPAPVSVKHGDKLDVLQVRRRFVRVRTSDGREGWTETRNLLGPEQMEALNQLAKRAAALPSQGEATVYGTLNMHSEPSRTATSFYQITEGNRADVVGHLLVPKKDVAAPEPFQIAKPKPRAALQKPKKESGYTPPPRPTAPAVPSNWQELSKTSTPQIPEKLIAQEEPKKQVRVPVEDWSLVRTKNSKAGWVLTRSLTMAIPDEVAQYSEGARITSYFALKGFRDGDVTRHHWLWTTMRDTGEPFDFDSFRVFIYMLRRHRFETAYIERRVEGYYPVTVSPGDVPKFALITRTDDGNLIRRTFVLEGYQVRKVSEEPYQMRSGTPGATIAGEAADEEKAGEDNAGQEVRPKLTSLMDRLRSWFGRK